MRIRPLFRQKTPVRVLAAVAFLSCTVAPDAFGQETSRVGLLVAPTVAFPFGELFEDKGSHVGVKATGNVYFAPGLAAALTYQFQPLSLEGSIPSGLDASSRVQKYLVGFQYLRAQAKPATVYGSLEMGLYRFTNKVTSQAFGQTVSASETKFGFSQGLGVVYWLTPKAGVDFSTHFDQTVVDGSWGYLFELHAGIRVSP